VLYMHVFLRRTRDKNPTKYLALEPDTKVGLSPVRTLVAQRRSLFLRRSRQVEMRKDVQPPKIAAVYVGGLLVLWIYDCLPSPSPLLLTRRISQTFPPILHRSVELSRIIKRL